MLHGSSIKNNDPARGLRKKATEVTEETERRRR